MYFENIHIFSRNPKSKDFQINNHVHILLIVIEYKKTDKNI
jgi:hypothetical protein